MKNSEELSLIMNLSKAHFSINRKMDARLSCYGIGLSDFVILQHLQAAPEHKMRRVDIAAAVGLTASGITRVLAPMEKYGLVTRESNERDARVSFVVITSGGKRLLSQARSTAIDVAKSFFSASTPEEILIMNTTLKKIINLIG